MLPRIIYLLQMVAILWLAIPFPSHHRTAVFTSAIHLTNGLEVIASGPSVVDVSRRNDSVLNYPPLGERINLKAVDPVTAIPVASEEEKLQTILRTLRKLPPDELDRLGVDLSEDVVVPGSERAMILLQAWEQRQEELKEAMKALMKPAEFMGNLTQQLREKAILFADLVASSSETGKRSKEVRELTEEMNQLLIDLESLLTDVDNGRDFHSIGAWPTLVSFLSRTFPLSVRARAAWAMGSAMKNSYDYQLWTLEPLDLSLTLPSSLRSVESQSNVSALELLLHNFRQSANLFASLSPDDMFFVDALDFQKRSIYALSSALRGNIDVQDFIQLHHLDLFLDSLQSFLRTSSTEELQKKYQVTIIRKIFSLISDLLDERQYIRYDLSAAMRAQLFSTPAITTTTTTTSTHQEVTGTISLSHNSNSSSSPSESGRRSEDDIESISSQLQRLQLLGDHLFAPQFGVGEGEGEVASDVTASVLRLIERYLAQLQTYKSESMESSVRNEWVCTHQTIEVGLTILSSFLRQHQLQHQQQLPAFLRLQQYSSLLLTLLEKLTQSPSITQNASYEDIVARGKELREAITPLLLR